MIIVGAVLCAVPVDREAYVPLASYLPEALISHSIPREVHWRGHVITVHIAQSSPFAGFNVVLKTAVLLALIGGGPVLAWEIYQWLKPALYPHERRLLRNALIVAALLFTAGVVVALLVVVPVAFRFMIITSAAVAGQDMIIAFGDLEQLYTTIILIAAALGLAFQAPLAVYLLVRHGIVSSTAVTGEYRRYVLVASMVLGAAISPDPSGLGMITVGTLMYLSIMAAAKLAGRG